MSTVTSVFEVLRGRPHHQIGDDGRMALADHLRELRARLIRSVLVLVVLFIVALFFYNDLLTIVSHPIKEAQHNLTGGTDSKLVLNGATAGLTLQLKLCGVAALIGSAPYWLAQIWGFVVPGLKATEKKWTRIFVAVAGPLFLLGVAVGYYVLPKGLAVLISFTPKGAINLVDFQDFFSFFSRMLLIFGISFEIPLFVVMLNLAGVISGKKLAKSRPFIILGTVIFAAVATPSTDPFSMLMLAIPMLLLFVIAEVIARVSDRARGRNKISTDQWSDDEVSEIDDLSDV